MILSQCDCCRREVGETFVCSSSTGPVSLAYCKECLKHRAEPEWTFHYLYDYVSTDGGGLAEWVQSLSTYKDDKYLTWSEWLLWRQTEPQKSELDQKRDNDLKELESYGEQ